AVAGDAHARQALIPSVRCRIVGFEGAERGHDLVVLELSAADVDFALVDAAGNATTRRWHLRPGRPQVLRDVIFLGDVGVARAGDEGRSEPAADGIDLSIDFSAEEVIAGRWHWRARAPTIGRGVIFLVYADAHVARFAIETNSWIGRAGQDGRAADDIDLAVVRDSAAAAA